jgi:hypothetical protein
MSEGWFLMGDERLVMGGVLRSLFNNLATLMLLISCFLFLLKKREKLKNEDPLNHSLRNADKIK